MDFSVSKEAFVFLCSALSGAGIFLLYDLFRIVRRKAGAGKLFTNIQDCVFWMLAFVVMFFVIFNINNGVLRFYEIIGAGLGAVLYGFTLSGPILRVLDAIIAFFSKIFKFFLKILLTPLIFTYNIIFRYTLLALRPIVKLFRRVVRRVFENIKQTRRLIRKN